MTIQEDDDNRLNHLKKSLKCKSKVEVLRKALDLLEDKLNRRDREARWIKAAHLCSKESSRVNKEFRNNPLLTRPEYDD